MCQRGTTIGVVLASAIMRPTPGSKTEWAVKSYPSFQKLFSSVTRRMPILCVIANTNGRKQDACRAKLVPRPLTPVFMACHTNTRSNASDKYWDWE